MRINIISDLHLEVYDKLLNPIDNNAHITVIAGDFSQKRNRPNYLSKLYPNRSTIIVDGNHEYYGDIFLPPMVEETIIGDIVFLSVTLWSDFELNGNAKQSMEYASRSINDYNAIYTSEGTRIKPVDTLNTHRAQKKDLIKHLKVHEGKRVVVVTHHAPHLGSLHEMYKGDALNPVFISNLEDVILKYQPEVWVHGHVHQSHDYYVGKTRVVCNPRGYVYTNKYGNIIQENPDFDINFCINL